MPTRQDNIEITPDYCLGDFYQNDSWKRLTLFHKVAISNVGSNNTPIAQVDIVKHPGNEYFNSHSEIKFTIRNDLKRQGHEVQIDKNKKDLRHPNEIVDSTILDKVIDKIKECHLAALPISIYVCMEHVEDFKTEGDFWSDD